MLKAAHIVAACLALVACSHTSNEPHLEATVVTETLIEEVNIAVTPATLVGRWGVDGDCSNDVVINVDRTFRSYAHGIGTWTLDGNILTLTSDTGRTQMWVGTIGADRLVFGRQDNSAEVAQRCP